MFHCCKVFFDLDAGFPWPCFRSYYRMNYQMVRTLGEWCPLLREQYQSVYRRAVPISSSTIRHSLILVCCRRSHQVSMARSIDSELVIETLVQRHENCQDNPSLAARCSGCKPLPTLLCFVFLKIGCRPTIGEPRIPKCGRLSVMVRIQVPFLLLALSDFNEIGASKK